MSRPIDADALNTAIEKWFDGVCVYDVSPSEAVNDFQSIVEEQPTITANEVRPVGEWNWTVEGDEDYEQFWVCSRCGAKMYFATNYCPNCGAKMGGRDE